MANNRLTKETQSITSPNVSMSCKRVTGVFKSESILKNLLSKIYGTSDISKFYTDQTMRNSD